MLSRRNTYFIIRFCTIGSLASWFRYGVTLCFRIDRVIIYCNFKLTIHHKVYEQAVYSWKKSRSPRTNGQYFIKCIFFFRNIYVKKIKSRFKNLTIPIQLDLNCRNISKIISYFTPQFLSVDLLVGCFEWLSLLSNPQ